MELRPGFPARCALMYSVGLDMVECSRIEKAMRSQRFAQRVFGCGELALLQERGYPDGPGRRWIETAAAGFCAKEAFGKAMGTGVRGFHLREVELLREESGRPFLRLTGSAAALAEGMCFSVSVTHTKEYASVVVLAEEMARK